MDKDGTIQIRVSEEMPVQSQVAVVIHEVFELALLAHGMFNNQRLLQGLTDQVDLFDKKFEANRQPDDESEPGDAAAAPYRDEHCLATGIERIFLGHLGLAWSAHEDHINELFKRTL